MEISFSCGEVELRGHLSRPSSTGGYPPPAVVIAHGFPSAPGDDGNSDASFPSLADRVATSMGWLALTFQFRGTGTSGGDFSLRGWLDDLGAAVEHLRVGERTGGIWVTGFGTGGSLAVCAGAADPDIRGVATIAAPADFADWARRPRELLSHARAMHAITDDDFPASFGEWSAELGSIRAESAAAEVAPRPLLVMHGSRDELVPALDARAVAEAHGAADLRIITGAGHRLRHDPRAMAVLLGWLDRQRHRAGI